MIPELIISGEEANGEFLMLVPGKMLFLQLLRDAYEASTQNCIGWLTLLLWSHSAL